MVSRDGKQCRERYVNHLDPDIKVTAWSTEEDQTLKERHAELPSKWSLMREHLPGKMR